MVKAPCLLSEKKCETITAYAARDLESSLEEAPEAFDTVGMYDTSHVHPTLMIDLFVREEVEHVRIPRPSVGVYESGWLRVCSQHREQRDAFEIGNRSRDDLPGTSTQHAENGLFAGAVPALGAKPSNAPRLVAPLSSNEGFVDFHRSLKGLRNVFDHHHSQVMQHTLHTMSLQVD